LEAQGRRHRLINLGADRFTTIACRRKQSSSVGLQAPKLPRKLGANHSETAARPRKHHSNFKQSCDLREDRGVRQIKSQPKNRQ
jgi:hypothetical protein